MFEQNVKLDGVTTELDENLLAEERKIKPRFRVTLELSRRYAKGNEGRWSDFALREGRREMYITSYEVPLVENEGRLVLCPRYGGGVDVFYLGPLDPQQISEMFRERHMDAITQLYAVILKEYDESFWKPNS